MRCGRLRALRAVPGFACRPLFTDGTQTPVRHGSRACVGAWARLAALGSGPAVLARVRRNNSRIRKLSDSRIFRASIADSGFSHGRQEPIRALGWTPGAARLAARARPCSPASVAQCAPCSAARIVVQALPARARHPAALQFPTSTPARRPPIPTRFGDAPPVTQGLICPQRWPGRYAPPAPCCARWPACCHWPRRPPRPRWRNAMASRTWPLSRTWTTTCCS